MEQFNSKLYDKYINLKKRKVVEEEDWNHKRDSSIKNYQTAVEDLIEELKNENSQLRSEIASIQVEKAECQKLLLEETQKTNKLANEVERIQNLLSQKHDYADNALRSPYTSPRFKSRDICRGTPNKQTPSSRTVQSEVQHKEAPIIPCDSHQEEQILPDCCRRKTKSLEDARKIGHITCAFQILVEFLVGMKFSLECQTEGLCLSVIHQTSGYTFTLTWINHEAGEEGELMYHVSSLGTLERVALEWMKEDLVFSMTMCPIFFERISRVVGRS